MNLMSSKFLVYLHFCYLSQGNENIHLFIFSADKYKNPSFFDLIVSFDNLKNFLETQM